MPSPLPQHCPSPRELDDLELFLNGALAPRQRFDDADDPRSTLTLTLPDELRGQRVELVDPEGLPLATMEQNGVVNALSHPQFGPFRSLRITPAEARSRFARRGWIPVDDALTQAEITRLAQRGPLVLAALVGHGTPRLSPVALVRATLAAAALLPDAEVVAIPLADHPSAPAGAQERLRERVIATYAGPDPVWPLGAHASETMLADLPESVAAIVAQDRPEPADQGLVIFFTGLSGSGKSTIARALVDRLLEQGRRTVTSLDGDVVRRNLSAGLSFSKADRETNIRRIGWVGAEIARHGGVAVCSPIAPFDETRQQVRGYVSDAGGRFFLVHVATPLAECEKRDRKGLYAQARAGKIPEFTGISSPYEEPEDADVRVDTTGRSIVDVVDEVVRALDATGLTDLGGSTHSGAQSSPELPALDIFGSSNRTADKSATEDAPQRAGSRAAVMAPTASDATGEVDEDDRHLAVAFVCTANVCRSPYMELRAAALTDSELEVVSVGTEAQRGRQMDEEMAALLPEGADKGFSSHFVTGSLVDAADLMLCAEQSHVDALLERYPHAFRKIFTLGQFAETVKDSSLQGRALIAQAGLFRTPPKPEHNIEDPYKQGPEAAATAAQHIDTYLEQALPVLLGRSDKQRAAQGIF